MIESNLATLMSCVCRDAGKIKGVEFHPPVAWGAPVPGRWEVSCRLKQQGWSVTLIYWTLAKTGIEKGLKSPAFHFS